MNRLHTQIRRTSLESASFSACVSLPEITVLTSVRSLSTSFEADTQPSRRCCRNCEPIEWRGLEARLSHLLHWRLIFGRRVPAVKLYINFIALISSVTGILPFRRSDHPRWRSELSQAFHSPPQSRTPELYCDGVQLFGALAAIHHIHSDAVVRMLSFYSSDYEVR